MVLILLSAQRRTIATSMTILKCNWVASRTSQLWSSMCSHRGFLLAGRPSCYPINSVATTHQLPHCYLVRQLTTDGTHTMLPLRRPTSVPWLSHVVQKYMPNLHTKYKISLNSHVWISTNVRFAAKFCRWHYCQRATSWDTRTLAYSYDVPLEVRRV